MTKKAIILFFSLVTLTNLNVQNVYAENSEILTENINIEKDNRESFLLIPFFNWQGSNKNFYENMATGKFNRQLSYYPKFNIISDPELDKTIVEIDIDQNRQNILNFAREKRIKNILFCRFKENDNSFNDININQNDISSNNLINNQNFFNKRIVLEIEIVDVYTGETKVTITDSILQIRKALLHGIKM